ncbi:O-antigen ligase family protein [Oribacterium sp. HCP3S3_B9]|uniref:O-antigen ligase family protein n=1 Tax=Oribacterium sp. HCP3S3_B9 TaxID=3438946 RepID=UPI003F8A0FDD
MEVTYKQISNIAMTLFFAVALNPEWSSNPIFWWGSVFLALGVYAATHHFSVPFRMTQFKTWFLLFFCVCLLSIPLAINRSNSLNTMKTLVVLIIILFVIDDEIQTDQDLEKYMQMYMVAVFVMMLYVVLNVDLNNFQLSQHGWADTGMWNGNDVGLKCAVFLIFSLHSFNLDRRVFRRFYLLVGSVLALVLLYFTASRKALLIAVFGIALYYYFKHPNKRFRNLLIIIFGIYAAFQLVMNVPELYEAIGWRIEGMLSLVSGKGTADSSALLRARYIQVGFDAFKKSPIIGYGVDNYRFINLRETGHFTYSHNNFVDILVGVGILGFFCYYSYYIKLVFDFLKLYLRRNTSMLLNTVAICFLCYFAMHIAVVSYNDILQNILILFFAKALVIQKSSNVTEELE